MTRFKFTALATAAFTISGFAIASAGSPAEKFAKIDADANGMISQVEYTDYKTAGGKTTAG